MKFNLFTMSLLTACILYPVASAIADNPPDPTPQLTKIYAKIDEAADQKNVDVCMSVFSPDFLLINTTGKVDDITAQYGHLLEVFAQFNQIDVTTTINNCIYTSTTATVEITQHLKVSKSSDDGGKPVVLQGNLSARELWTKYSDGWKMDVAQTLGGGALAPAR